MKKSALLLLILIMACSASKSLTSAVAEMEYPEHLKIVKRADWGWLPVDTLFKTHNIEYITVHHGGVEFTADKEPFEHVKNLQTWSRSEKKWIDIPYHFMISPAGDIFETRPLNIPGDTNTEYDPTGHILLEVMGNFEIQQIGKKQFKAMIDLIKFLSAQFNIHVEKIKTHKDYSQMTVCPGQNLYKFFKDGTVEKALK